MARTASVEEPDKPAGRASDVLRTVYWSKADLPPDYVPGKIR